MKLPVGDLITASQVCRRWLAVSGDNLLWKQYYAKFAGPVAKEKEANTPVHELNPHYWKSECLKKCKMKRDAFFLKKWKQPDRYTGLRQRPELSLGKAGVKFDLSFINTRGVEFTVGQSDLFWMTTSCTVRWYDLFFPEVKDISGLRIRASSPLLFYGPAKPAKDGIFQPSLLVDIKVNLSSLLLNPVASDNHVELFRIHQEVTVGKFKNGGEIAFVVATFHYHNFVSRCLCGYRNSFWTPSILNAAEDDIDPNYGLHGYTCLLQLRNSRQKIVEFKFIDLFTKKEELSGGFATMSPVLRHEKNTHVSCVKKINFPWKTALFKGIIQNVCILDLTILDEFGEAFWTLSSTVQVKRTSETDQFEMNHDEYRSITYQDNQGKIYLEIGKVDENFDDGEFLCQVSISLSLEAINKYFRTSY